MECGGNINWVNGAVLEAGLRASVLLMVGGGKISRVNGWFKKAV